ncbi:phosphohistidine phosphatase SixA [Desulfopila sp. IMCC35008]|uniref:phosphohistidine phosphatase SixA n=1 Tax=Desulfopila sp. IMCC35008 TaxID=2653858 RepID=UPI0013D0E0E6|nr:phosphohistidine phosphatase SixA [Desulfopila sp. IMCC35008]
MAIYLVQHGLSLSENEDSERSLSGQGVADVRLIGGVACNYKVVVDTIFHSGKKRARQTAELLAEFLNPKNGCSKRDGLGPMDDVISFADELHCDSDMMFVGHLPFMEKLVSVLITGSSDYKPFKFQNGGIVCLDRDGDGWHVKWALMPNVG